LEDHADRDRDGHPHDVARDRALGHVSHRSSGTLTRGVSVKSSWIASTASKNGNSLATRQE
jgi:hypothetical protein